ncbi:MAG: response regulator, partial [Thermoproteota archaeon]|nr:response regulator [Thermoproteota archaeon]
MGAFGHIKEQITTSILVVDDEIYLATLFREFLAKAGYNAVVFTNPLLALEHFKNNPNRYSIIITDLRMPGMSGLELAKKIRELNTPIKIFVVTAFDVSDLKSKPV